MIYMGSKNRIAKEIIPIITKDLKENQYYVEPFVGGANMIDKIDHKLKIGSDYNKYLIALLKYVQAGKPLPVYIARDEHAKVKANPSKYDDWYVGYVGFVCSFRGIYFGGYTGNNTHRKNGRIEHHQTQQRNNLLK